MTDHTRKPDRPASLDRRTFLKQAGAIGAGAFWTGMVDFIGGTSAQEVADTIQTAWDAIKE